MKRLLFFLLLIALFTAPANLKADDSKPFVTDAPVPVEAVVGQEFELRLESNRTTGYSWSLVKNYSHKILNLIATDYEASKTGLMGAPGTQIWKFTADSEGQTEVIFHYARSWEKDVPPVRERSFVITVKPAPEQKGDR